MSLYLGENLISGVATPIQGARNIGQIIQSTIPLTDAGLHLLDGALISGSGSYADFVTYISGLVSAYPDLFETEANWQTSVTNYGVCGKFVYDSANNTVRLPKITGFVEGTTDATALGDLIQAGLPNISGTFAPYVGGDHSGIAWDDTSYQLTGAFYRTSIGNGKTSTETNGSYARAGLGLDASRSSSIYGNSSTVQPQSVKVLYYIVIATSIKTDIQVDIDEIATDLNGKADTDLSNCTKPYITETYVNGTSWYRVYSDGWCEQGGVSAKNLQTIQLLKAYANTDYIVFGNIITTDAQQVYGNQVNIMTKTTTNFSFPNSSGAQRQWHACGYIS